MAAEIVIALKLLEIVSVAAPWIVQWMHEGREADVKAALASCYPRAQHTLEAEVDDARDEP